MKRVIELDLVTKSEANQRFASKAGMFAKSERVKAQRAVVATELARHFGAQVPPFFVLDGNVSGPNKIAVKLTRIAPGTLDDDNLRGALKAVRDAVAKWIGIDDRNPIAAWSYEQRSAGQHVYRVEIEVVDRAPGNERIVRLAETGSEGRAAASRVKRAVTAQTRKTARKATSAQDAAMLTKLRAQARSVNCPVCKAVSPAHTDPLHPYTECVSMNEDPFEYGVHVARARAAGCPPMPDVAALNRGERPQLGPDGDEDKSPRMLAACPTCRAGVGEPCEVKRGTSVPMVAGVHVFRARLAGLAAAGARALAKAPRTGVRKLAPVAVSQPELPVMRAWVALPWEQTPCDACDGDALWLDPAPDAPGAAPPTRCGACNGSGRGALKLRPMPRLDGLMPPPDILMRVPAEHVQRHGTTITLARRRYESAEMGVCWIYETKEAKEGRTT